MFWIALKPSHKIAALIIAFHLLAAWVVWAYVDLMPVVIISGYIGVWRLAYGRHMDDVQIIFYQHGIWQVKTAHGWQQVELECLQHIGWLFLCFKATDADKTHKRFVVLVTQERIGAEPWRRLQVAIRTREMS